MDATMTTESAIDLDVPCTETYHMLIKITPALFRAATMALGVQQDGEGGGLELGNCRRCFSTLAIPASLASGSSSPVGEGC